MIAQAGPDPGVELPPNAIFAHHGLEGAAKGKSHSPPLAFAATLRHRAAPASRLAHGPSLFPPRHDRHLVA